MHFLANENFPRAAIDLLRTQGHDVVWVRTARPGSTDHEVLDWAIREKRVLLTFDKDFGELARASKLPRECGVVLIRVRMPPPDQVGGRIAALVSARHDWSGNFSVIEPGRVRVRPLGPETNG
jgi:predicted nuclease of predicted toxin-antitoxin system